MVLVTKVRWEGGIKEGEVMGGGLGWEELGEGAGTQRQGGCSAPNTRIRNITCNITYEYLVKALIPLAFSKLFLWIFLQNWLNCIDFVQNMIFKRFSNSFVLKFCKNVHDPATGWVNL